MKRRFSKTLSLYLKLTTTLLVLLFIYSCTQASSHASEGSKPNSEDRINASSQFNHSLKTFINTLPESGTEDRPSLKIVYDFFFSKNNRRPEKKLPEIAPSSETLAANNQSLSTIWLGHSTILLGIEGKRILLDPIFSSYASPLPGVIKRFQPPAIQLKDIPDIDLVLISHNHYDHLDKPTIKQLAKRDTYFFVPLGIAKLLENWGVEKNRIQEFDWWESARTSGLTITATPAQHFSGRGLFDSNKTLWTSWSIVGQSQRVFYSGDSGYSPHYKEIGDKLGPFNLTLLENGAYNDNWSFIHQTPEQAVQAHIDLRGEVLLPVHWGMFDLGLHSWHEPIERIAAAAEKNNITLATPRLGEIINFTDTIPTQQWWKPFIRSVPK